MRSRRAGFELLQDLVEATHEFRVPVVIQPQAEPGYVQLLIGENIGRFRNASIIGRLARCPSVLQDFRVARYGTVQAPRGPWVAGSASRKPVATRVRT